MNRLSVGSKLIAFHLKTMREILRKQATCWYAGTNLANQIDIRHNCILCPRGLEIHKFR